MLLLVCLMCWWCVVYVSQAMNVFTVRPITNFNELTYHNMRAIFEHLHFTKGGAGGQQVGWVVRGGAGHVQGPRFTWAHPWERMLLLLLVEHSLTGMHLVAPRL